MCALGGLGTGLHVHIGCTGGRMEGSDARGDLHQFIVLGRGSLAGFSSVKSSRPLSGSYFQEVLQLGILTCPAWAHATSHLPAAGQAAQSAVAEALIIWYFTVTLGCWGCF